MATSVVDELANEEVRLELTPMIDVSFLILIFFMCLPFKTLEGKLQAFLPTDKGINPIPQDPPNEIKVQIHIVARDEVPRQWGPKNNRTTHNMPSKVKYRFGEQESDDLAKVATWIEGGFKAAQGTDAKVIGEIKAGHKVPHKFIVAVLNKFAEKGLDKVDFFGTQIPGPELRKQKLLPYPAKNYVTE